MTENSDAGECLQRWLQQIIACWEAVSRVIAKIALLSPFN